MRCIRALCFSVVVWLSPALAGSAFAGQGMPLNLLSFMRGDVPHAGAAGVLAPSVAVHASLYAPGTIVVNTHERRLYYYDPTGGVIEYPVGVGREGFAWRGTSYVERKQAWPAWYPPPEMLVRQPYLPRYMAGGLHNPLGARALYIAGTLYRIHGTSEPDSIGKAVSSGCIRMLNADVEDLYDRVKVGTKVVVLN